MAGIVHGGGLTAAITLYGGAPGDWLDLSTGINPNMPALPPIPAEVWNRLPDQALVDRARMAARDWYRANDLPLAVPGTQAFIQVLPKLVPSERPVAVVSPTYGEYAHCFRKNGFVVDAISSPSELRPEHGALVVVNPNNPDGRRFGRDTLLALHARLRAQDGHLHVDEAFGDTDAEHSLVRDASAIGGLTVSRSFGKFFGMAGVRLGFVFAPSETLAMIAGELGPWAVSGPALYLAWELMGADRCAILTSIRGRKAGLETVLQDAGLAIVGGTELFALVAHAKAAALFEHLARAHILVRKFDYAEDWLRIGLAPDVRGDRKLAAALASFGA